MLGMANNTSLRGLLGTCSR